MSNRGKAESKELPVLSFAGAAEFRRWLMKHHAAHPGIWMKIAKKGSGVESITYAEALDEALCFGWIDGQKKPFDRTAWLQNFTRRGPRSQWSKINTGHVERLTREGRMHAAGLAAVEAAKADGRWERAYVNPGAAKVPEDFLEALREHPDALAFFNTLGRTNHYAIFYRLTSAKRLETREKRLKEFVEKMKRGEKLY